MEFRKKFQGKVEQVRDDPFDPEFHAWVDVTVGGELLRLMVPKKIVAEQDLLPGSSFSWLVWKWWILDIFFNEVQDITESHPPNKAR